MIARAAIVEAVADILPRAEHLGCLLKRLESLRLAGLKVSEYRDASYLDPFHTHPRQVSSSSS